MRALAASSEFEGGMINAIGLANPGVDEVLA